MNNLYYYMRGVAPKEARLAMQGLDGRVSDEQTITARQHESKLAFGLNEYSVAGINQDILDELLPLVTHYANFGAHAERFEPLDRPHYHRSCRPDVRGYILLFAVYEPLELSNHQNFYGQKWRTTAILPVGVEHKLVGIIPAKPMSINARILSYNEGDYSIFGPKHPAYTGEGEKHFTALHSFINKI